ncbi:hypothetical protein LSAT2_004146, partial [Lamellibrachia satsuma]
VTTVSALLLTSGGTLHPVGHNRLSFGHAVNGWYPTPSRSQPSQLWDAVNRVVTLHPVGHNRLSFGHAVNGWYPTPNVVTTVSSRSYAPTSVQTSSTSTSRANINDGDKDNTEHFALIAVGILSGLLAVALVITIFIRTRSAIVKDASWKRLTSLCSAAASCVTDGDRVSCIESACLPKPPSDGTK